MRQRLFRRMLAREAGTGANAPAIAAAARRVCERFEQLTPLIGDAGVAAICTRSLHLAQRNIPGLATASRSRLKRPNEVWPTSSSIVPQSGAS